MQAQSQKGQKMTTNSKAVWIKTKVAVILAYHANFYSHIRLPTTGRFVTLALQCYLYQSIATKFPSITFWIKNCKTLLISPFWTRFNKSAVRVLRGSYESRHKTSSLFINFWKSSKINIFGWAWLRCPVLTSRFLKIFDRKVPLKYRTCSRTTFWNPIKLKGRVHNTIKAIIELFL